MDNEPEFDIEKQIAHWRGGADEAWEAAVDMINRDHRIQFGLFLFILHLKKLSRHMYGEQYKKCLRIFITCLGLLRLQTCL